MDLRDQLKQVRVVVTLLACNLGTASVAAVLGISPKTVLRAKRNIRNQQGSYATEHSAMENEGVQQWIETQLDDSVVRRISELHPNALNGQGLHSGLWRRIHAL